MEKNILKQLKSDYEDLEIKPSANLWDKLENKLDENAETAEKPLFQWWKYAAAVILLISLGGLFYFNSEDSPTAKQTIASENQPKDILNQIKNIETVGDPVNDKISENSGVIKLSEATEKQAEKIAYNQPDDIKEITKTAIIAPKIDLKPESEIITRQEISESPELVVLERPESQKIKYITANDLIFQRKYSIEKKENTQENAKRLGIIKINKISINPELITVFDGNTTNE